MGAVGAHDSAVATMQCNWLITCKWRSTKQRPIFLERICHRASKNLGEFVNKTPTNLKLNRWYDAPDLLHDHPPFLWLEVDGRTLTVEIRDVARIEITRNGFHN